ncbi:AAA family ATPase [Brevibacillus fulvus]|uniref:Nuclease SbcCD subunit C n=1 Tax=Brevibacillus fulvus TaxID=1125967 RepID=A0A938Y3T7_9BACL|nr:AAA family ATPase [Brevibacillus fulvus]MBM7591087.1 exonuclease SbcC [Brevibacillus fulvus]
MKPIWLKIAGLHSYRELQEIDFAKLSEAGLFGIFGPTGSGKSTILDAITLALYGQVVRLGGGTHPKEVLNQLEQRVFVSFTFEIGAGDRRKRYTIEREFGLDKKGNRRQPEVRLIERGTDGVTPDKVLESKATAATQAIESLIGLTLQDFTRAVVLPQGQFSRFLTLKGSERNEMLQRMFQLHEYGEKLNERIRTRYEQNKTELHRLQLELAAIGDVGPEALEHARQTLELAEQQSKAYAAQREELSAKKREMEQVYQWQVERAAIEQQAAALQSRQAEIEQIGQKVKEIEASLQIWPLWQKYRKLSKEWDELGLALAQLRQQQQSAASEWEQADQEYQSAAATLRQQEPLLAEQKGKLLQAVEWEKELAALARDLQEAEREQAGLTGQLHLLHSQIDQLEQALVDLDKQWAELEQQVQQVVVTPEERQHLVALREVKEGWSREQQKLQELVAQKAELQKERQALTADLQQLADEVRQQATLRERTQNELAACQEKPLLSETELERLREQLMQAKQLGKEWREQVNLLNAWSKKWAELEQRWGQQERDILQLEEQQRKLTEVHQRARDAYEQVSSEWQSWQRENLARMLRKELSDGEACPVCGSTHHPLRHTELTEEAQTAERQRWEQKLAQMEEEVAQAERQLREATDSLQAAKINGAALAEQRRSQQEEKASIDERVAQIKAECAALGADWQTEDFEALLMRYKQNETAFRVKTEERARQKDMLEQLQQRLAQVREQELLRRSSQESKQALLNRLQDQLAVVDLRLAEATEQLRQAESKFTQLRGELLPEEIESRYRQLEERDRLLIQLAQQRTELEKRRKDLAQQSETEKERRTQLTIRATALQERRHERAQLQTERQRQLFAVTQGEAAASLLTQIESKLAQLQKSVQTAEQRRTQAMERRQQVHERLLKAEEACSLLNRQRMEAELVWQTGMQQAGLADDVSRLEALYQESERLEAYREQVDSYNRQQTQLQYERDRLGQLLAGRSVTEEEWQSMLLAWEQLERTYEAFKDEVAVARQTLQQISANHDKWVGLQAKIFERVDEQSRLEELKKLFEGKAFVQFIAEEKLAAIAADASYHLKRMTKNRYALEIGDEGEFVLRDEGAGGMRRPVNTLSGGETFLTSLALALALSVEIQMRGGKLEFFFLDEGFGTLDPELLETVMDALERLRMDRFTIGLISHVPEMRLRMPRRLVITPAEPLGAGSQIRLEMD